MVKNQIKKFFAEHEENLVFAVDDIIKRLKMLADAKCPRNFLRAYLANVKSLIEGSANKAK